jgi:MSHA biogenesis protein MshP
MMKRYAATHIRGFLLPAAIFILVILAALGAYALNVSSIQQATSVQDVQGSRAYQAARAGIDWGVYQVMDPGTANLANCPAATSLTIEGFTVAVTCSQFADYNEQGSDHIIRVFQITSTASFGTAGTINFSERQLQVTLSKCRGVDATPAYQCG